MIIILIHCQILCLPIILKLIMLDYFIIKWHYQSQCRIINKFLIIHYPYAFQCFYFDTSWWLKFCVQKIHKAFRSLDNGCLVKPYAISYHISSFIKGQIKLFSCLVTIEWIQGFKVQILVQVASRGNGNFYQYRGRTWGGPTCSRKASSMILVAPFLRYQHQG